MADVRGAAPGGDPRVVLCTPREHRRSNKKEEAQHIQFPIVEAQAQLKDVKKDTTLAKAIVNSAPNSNHSVLGLPAKGTRAAAIPATVTTTYATGIAGD
eukprot:gene42585-55168_t